MVMKLLFVAFVLFGDLVVAKKSSFDKKREKDNVELLIENAGFRSEIHDVETQDGYILKVHRLMKKSGPSRAGPVFLMHGLIATSADYLMTGPDRALPYYLSENGYDVWLGNSRGNNHGLRHRKLKADSRAFWEFSFHEIGFYDVPAMFDFMLITTNTSRGFYVGHSQGRSAFAVMASLHPAFNKKVIQAHLFAPAIFMKYFPYGMVKCCGSELIELYRSNVGSYGFKIDIDDNKPVKVFNEFWCGGGMTQGLCLSTLFLICGQNKDEVETDQSILPTHLNHMAHSASVRQFLHYLQLIKSGRFAQFDYDVKLNKQRYNSSMPPDYPLANIKCPVYVYAGSCDTLVAERDLEHFTELLPNLKNFTKFGNYNHCDFNYGKNARSTLYKDVLSAFNSA